MAVRPAAQETASVRLPAAASVGMSRRLLTTRIAVTRAPGGIAAATEERLEPQRLEVRRADHGDEPEEDEDEDLAEGPVAVREGAAGVGEGGHDRERPEGEEHRPADQDEPEADESRQADDDRDRDLQLALGDEAGGGDPRRARPVGRVGALPEVREVVGEVGQDLEQEGDGEAREGGVGPERGRRRRARRRGPRPPPTPRRGAWRADREEPGAEGGRRGPRRRGHGRRPGRRGRGPRLDDVDHGRRGNFVKSGDRFSRKARDPSCASSVV